MGKKKVSAKYIYLYIECWCDRLLVACFVSWDFGPFWAAIRMFRSIPISFSERAVNQGCFGCFAARLKLFSSSPISGMRSNKSLWLCTHNVRFPFFTYALDISMEHWILFPLARNVRSSAEIVRLCAPSTNIRTRIHFGTLNAQSSTKHSAQFSWLFGIYKINRQYWNECANTQFSYNCYYFMWFFFNFQISSASLFWLNQHLIIPSERYT